jgi:hypothetical protein
MKSLESLKKFQVKFCEDLIGGTYYHDSFSCGGTVYSYDGEMYATNTSRVGSILNYANDFTGCISVDGHGQCNTWTDVSIKY